jgi:DNA-binding beta-propeller fold protein YncE
LVPREAHYIPGGQDASERRVLRMWRMSLWGDDPGRDPRPEAHILYARAYGCLFLFGTALTAPSGGQTTRAADSSSTSEPRTATTPAPGRTETARVASDRSQESVLRLVEDVLLPGSPSRFDYQGFDPSNGRLYIAHMGAGELLAFDTRTRQVAARAGGLPKATGVIAVPSLHRVYVSAAGAHRVAILEDSTLRTVAVVEGVTFPDGLAFAPDAGKVFVSDEFGRREIVIDVSTNRLRAMVPLNGEAGNTQYDSVRRQILVAVQTRNELVAIDPQSERIAGRYRLAGADHPHGVLIDAPARLAFVANEGNDKLLVVELETMRVTSEYAVGKEPDVLAFDPGLRRLYVASESGVVAVFAEVKGRLELLGNYTAPEAHSVAVNTLTHEVYLPLANIEGHPVLRILAPLDTLR